ncbi:cytoplasmic dynein 1 intermediate chain 2 [Thecamonas trahens ATCC 50062]|uniref:Cytoplasmic dynein 1 intermediate chain 2 n=1 Tax=Thecamonas trahens ATCC 50062 TaxID=461836 RepID=A0A0L0DP11_THETB|nr:cytoplasmic dynein 1 intermediate chain 2 [Thecamonas trahens ATCC 50062]KNC54047.1 cytoplasmic dynein 1 intermediate chain 2 [Thecamonas trahens ATCC 50062]|eukprot:XP_013754058.1 cytoplasmic dynein 1 intermediate chain 2 [Thecamonas trahens ATCC 50062]
MARDKGRVRRPVVSGGGDTQVLAAEEAGRAERIREAEARLVALRASLEDRVAAAREAAEARKARADRMRISLAAADGEAAATAEAGGIVADGEAAARARPALADAATGTSSGGDAVSGLARSDVVVHMVVRPRRRETYNKATQTRPLAGEEASGRSAAAAERSGADGTGVGGAEAGKAPDAEEGDDMALAVAALEAAMKSVPPAEREALAETRACAAFVGKAARQMERVLVAEERGKRIEEGREGGADEEEKRGLDIAEVFAIDVRSSGRDERGVCALDWSDAFPELFLVGYGDSYARGNNAFAPRGAVAPGYMELWSLSLPTVPEYVFRAQSPITSAALVRHHGGLVLGGTHSGQVVLWDTRTGLETPVAATQLAGANHGGPVRSAVVAGTANNLTLATISGDGAFITWAADSLAAPTERLNIGCAPSCMAFGSSSPNSFYIGTMTGSLWSVERHGSGKGLAAEYAHHSAMVSALSVSPHTATLDYDLLLATSFDWKTSLWRSDMSSPVYVFDEFVGYLYDVAWSPRHPSVFATAGARGRIQLWDLLVSPKEPVASIGIGESLTVTSLAFSSDGSRLLAGDTSGHTAVIRVTGAAPGDDDFDRLDAVLSALEQAL